MARQIVYLVVLVLSGSLAVDRGVGQQAVSFNRDIKPILAAKCFSCHGPDEEHRQADLRLDNRESAIETGAIVAGDLEGSTLIERIGSDDPEFMMPPPTTNKPLTASEKETLRNWIAEGARFDKHWAFVRPVRPELPTVKNESWTRNPIDRFVLRRLEQAGHQPSPDADRYTLVRRLYLDLIGLPPTIEEADAFVSSTDPLAYENLVDRLLASPRYGERWARPWLDLARYSDTNGYEKDRPRSIWPYRDWVIRALNDDMPYDQFTIEQLAGDMLPDSSPDQKTATGFHRNTMLNEEGGIDPLEYRYLAMVDRVATTGTVWLGLTTGCAQCHNHKYDPITHTDYFRFMGLMNNAEEPDFAIPDIAKQQERKRIERRIRELELKLADQFPVGEGDGPEQSLREKNMELEFNSWLNAAADKSSQWTTIVPYSMKTNSPKLEVLDDDSIFSTGDITKRDVFELKFGLAPRSGEIRSIKLEALPDERLPASGPGRTFYEGRKGDFFLSEITIAVDGKPVEFAGATRSYGDPAAKNPKLMSANVYDGDGSTGWMPGDRKGERLQLVLNLKEPIVTQPVGSADEMHVTLLFERHYAVSLGRFRFSFTSDDGAVANEFPDDVERSLARYRKRKQLNNEAKLKQYFLNTTPLLTEPRKPIEQLKNQLPKLTETMVFQERPSDHPRPTHRHHRGEYLSPREPVDPGIIDIFAKETPAEKRPTNRLEFARWLVSEDNPLVARVAVNRAWRELFGAGLLRTSGDFGVQSAPPTHPELLDWLAVEFVENDWSTKQLHRLIVNSATYRQESTGSRQMFEQDPENRLLARGPRFRATGETVRDVMLRSSGLLSEKMYGPGVRPPQPASVTGLAYGATRWQASTGEDRYRRSIYTFQKRTAAFAAFTTFDGTTGESCIARRNRSNTPLQALTILNDEMYLEFARALARRTLEQDLGSLDDRANFVFRSVLTRVPTDDELNSVTKYFARQFERLERGELKAAEIVADKKADNATAAWTMVARVVMNLDEAITKQ